MRWAKTNHLLSTPSATSRSTGHRTQRQAFFGQVQFGGLCRPKAFFGGLSLLLLKVWPCLATQARKDALYVDVGGIMG